MYPNENHFAWLPPEFLNYACLLAALVQKEDFFLNLLHVGIFWFSLPPSPPKPFLQQRNGSVCWARERRRGAEGKDTAKSNEMPGRCVLEIIMRLLWGEEGHNCFLLWTIHCGLNQPRGQCSENHLKCITRWEGRDGVTIAIFFQHTMVGN